MLVCTQRGVVIIVPIISKQRNLGLITVLRHHMTKAPKSNKVELSRRMSSRDLMIRIFDLGPSRGVRMLPVGRFSAVSQPSGAARARV